MKARRHPMLVIDSTILRQYGVTVIVDLLLVVLDQKSIQRWLILFAAESSSWVGFLQGTVITTIAVLTLFCEFSKEGTRGPMVAITSSILITVHVLAPIRSAS